MKFSSLVCEIWCSEGFQDAQTQTHSRMDRPKYSMPPAAPAPFFDHGGDIKMKVIGDVVRHLKQQKFVVLLDL